jgi:hypothetical protein
MKWVFNIEEYLILRGYLMLRNADIKIYFRLRKGHLLLLLFKGYLMLKGYWILMEVLKV